MVNTNGYGRKRQWRIEGRLSIHKDKLDKLSRKLKI